MRPEWLIVPIAALAAAFGYAASEPDPALAGACALGVVGLLALGNWLIRREK